MTAEAPRDRPAAALDIAVEAGDWPPAERLERIAESAVATALAEAGDPVSDGAEISLLFTDDAAIRELNARWRGKDRPTNVLSFPQAHGPLLGDIVLAAETVASEAGLAGRPLDHHIAHLIVHGTLHLLGYDHEEDDEAERMEALERQALSRMGIPDPYLASPIGND
ncbi:rRNA maturation RNase YbeY [Propylenella binzhouense]|uniref:Endoribonuclease YbeY n=1 Tax=Propylenella binzhouense TaxID=2555902 RepID=A0A964T2W0_9HYPH|nr:rRNA maturation RNase YbeY [Propylenella binzhouense]